MEYPVMEHFYTLQGEGAHAGRPAYFVRLAGCDVGCVWCDVKESWSAEGFPRLTPGQLLAVIRSTQAPHVVVTGGEPLMYDLEPLTATLRGAGLRLWLETSGAWPLSGQWDWVVLSPKKFKAPVAGLHERADELKVVVYHPSDLAWAQEHARRVRPDCRLFLQPEWSRRQKLEPLIVDFIKDHPAWQLSLQTHKYVGIP
ncbi:MAG: 7-carboxy-7-deazaguanine synthase QueE [Flavobacteriales bacterium]|nr:7-carboxy-7-deazaguanine synthase QueE [Flavobacteriales bacterium]MCX7649874.1 7-carboxy-7-deazaguanine synthase QueE [Flavobacteriales bacterium]MDW8432922.1 7-carboxy-7-deazaguanine synthase QueE [Flavobacteriales bacterium]